MQSIYQTMRFNWAVRALNPKSPGDKKSVDHAAAGIGYFILESPANGRNYFIVGYKNFTGQLNTGSDWANQHQIKTLDQMDARRYSQQ